MSILSLVTYATPSHEEIRKSLLESVTNIFDSFFIFTPDNIDPAFKIKNDEILAIKNGHKTTGAFLWKPYFILKALETINDGDILLYMDCGDFFVNTNRFKFRVEEAMAGQDMILTNGGYFQKDYCTRDCFVYMGCDEPKFHNAIQLEAGIGLYKKTESTIRFVKEWLSFCQDIRIIGDGPNVCGLPNYEGFVQHRWDQAVLSNLKYKYGINSGDFLRNYIKCNVNEPIC